MTTRYTLRMFTDDMGSFTQPGCRDKEDALWHVNSARDHDGLKPLTMEAFELLFPGTNIAHARFIQET